MATPQTSKALVAQLARNQAGVVSRQQLLACGLGRRHIDINLASKTWLALLAGIYIVAGAPINWTTWAWAGVLAAGDRSCLIGATAGAARGWCQEAWPITIAIPAHRRLRLPTNRIRVYRLDVPSDDIVSASGLPITNRLRTAVDVAHLLPIGEAQRLIDRWLVLEQVDLDALIAVINSSRRNGSRQARELARSAADLAASAAERLAHRVFCDAGLTGFDINHPVTLAGRIVKIDIAFVAAKIAVEINGWAFHAAPDRGRADAAKVADLQLAGWLVLTFSWHDLVTRPDYVVAKVRAAFTARCAA